MAGEQVVVKDLHDRGLCTPDACEFCKAAFKEAITTRFAFAQPSSVDPADFSVEWEGNSVGMFDESTAKMWAAHMNEAYLAGANTKAMPATLEDKLAVMLWYLEEVRQRRRGSDPVAFESYLDDTEVAAWLDKMNKAGRIRNTRFTHKRNS